MQNTSRLNSLKISIITGFTTLFLSGCIIHVGGGQNSHSDGNDVSSVFGSLSVSQGKHVRNVSSVNGSIDIANSVNAHTVDSVNGTIVLGNEVSTYSVKTVNGDITIGEQFFASTFVETVNGDITIGRASEVQSYIETVNGSIEIRGTNVGTDVITYNGDIHLKQNSNVAGDIVFRLSHKKQRNSTVPTLSIQRGATVEGSIVLERDVNLKIDDATLLDKVIYKRDSESPDISRNK